MKQDLLASAKSEGNVTLQVWRGTKAGGRFEPYTVPADEGMVVLDVIHKIQALRAPDLGVRWNCKAGKCGYCSAEINGHAALMCMTRMNTFAPGEDITVSPMKTFPIIKDLVTDVSYNYEKAKEIPAFKPKPKEADGTRRMFQEDIDRVQEFHKCIECFLCQDTCHVIRDHEENKQAFAGPRFFVRLAALEMHPLDTNDRLELIRAKAGLGFPHHRQRDHPAQGADRDRVLRPAGLGEAPGHGPTAHPAGQGRTGAAVREGLMGRRRAFVLGAGAVLLLVFLLVVVRPGVERGGIQEVLIIAAIFAGILVFERYLRTR